MRNLLHEGITNLRPSSRQWSCIIFLSMQFISLRGMMKIKINRITAAYASAVRRPRPKHCPRHCWLQRETRREPRNVSFDILRSTGQPVSFLLLEVFEDHEALVTIVWMASFCVIQRSNRSAACSYKPTSVSFADISTFLRSPFATKSAIREMKVDGS